jgi:biotin carboxyl carrier protein
METTLKSGFLVFFLLASAISRVDPFESHMIMLPLRGHVIREGLSLPASILAVVFAVAGISRMHAQDSPSAPAATPAAMASSVPAVSAAAPVSQMKSEMQRLKEEGKLTSNRAVSAAVRKVIRENSTQHELPAPLGAKVISVHKHPGDLVRKGDKIVTLLVDGKTVPILAKEDGVMQAINVSKGGVIGNSRPRAAKAGTSHHRTTGSILVTLTPLKA